MRLKVDENLPQRVAEFLSDAGHDATSVYSQGLSGATDERLIERCQRESRAMVTFDLDFADIMAYPPADYHGIIVLRLETQDVSHVIETMERLANLFLDEQDKLSGKLWIVDEERIRIHE